MYGDYFHSLLMTERYYGIFVLFLLNHVFFIFNLTPYSWMWRALQDVMLYSSLVCVCPASCLNFNHSTSSPIRASWDEHDIQVGTLTQNFHNYYIIIIKLTLKLSSYPLICRLIPFSVTHWRLKDLHLVCWYNTLIVWSPHFSFIKDGLIGSCATLSLTARSHFNVVRQSFCCQYLLISPFTLINIYTKMK